VIPRRLHLPQAWAPALATTGELQVAGAAHHYLATVLRLETGDTIELFDGTGRVRSAELLHVGRSELSLRLGPDRLVDAGEGSTRVALMASLTRGAALDRVVRQVTEIGCDELMPVLTARSVAVPPGERQGARQQRWQRIAEQAARQCGSARVPRVQPLRLLDLALTELDREQAWPIRLLAHPGSGQPLALREGCGGKGAMVLVGPEGGLAPAEVEQAKQHGFVPFGMGSRTLRAETAALVALTLLQHRLGRMG
jgi:16S rRNA (uracil1498-N3)-methyltransferase